MSLWRFASFWMYPLLACLLLWYSSASVQGSWISILLLITGGMLLWSILEYVLHRFVFHLCSPIPFVQKILERLHLGHHADPRNPDRILVRPIYSLSISAMLLGGLYSLTGTLFSASGLMSGIWLGFLYYETVHFRLHLIKGHKGLLGLQRRGHFYHHFLDSQCCFGVTSPLWDLVLGTYRRLD